LRRPGRPGLHGRRGCFSAAAVLRPLRARLAIGRRRGGRLLLGIDPLHLR
jgi:hypothetical protein